MKADSQPKWTDLSPELQAAAGPARATVRAGGSVLLMGPPGAGKTMVARRLVAELPLESGDSNLVAAIWRLAGLPGPSLLAKPFRAPHHTVSIGGLLGSGKLLRPGELSLAHRGILFLDELPEFNRSCLETIAQVQKLGKVVFAGGNLHLVSLPAEFVLVGAANSCPCGGTTSTRECQCSEQMIRRYHRRYSMLQFDCTVKLPWLPPRRLLAANS